MGVQVVITRHIPVVEQVIKAVILRLKEMMEAMEDTMVVAITLVAEVAEPVVLAVMKLQMDLVTSGTL